MSPFRFTHAPHEKANMISFSLHIQGPGMHPPPQHHAYDASDESRPCPCPIVLSSSWTNARVHCAIVTDLHVDPSVNAPHTTKHDDARSRNGIRLVEIRHGFPKRLAAHPRASGARSERPQTRERHVDRRPFCHVVPHERRCDGP